MKLIEFTEYILMAIHCAAAERVVIKKGKKESSSVKLKAFRHTCQAA